MTLEQDIGQRIAWLRKERGLTQAALGESLDRPWPRQAVHAAEKGARAFTAAELVSLASALGSTAAELLGSAGGPQTTDAARLQEAEEELVTVLARATELAALIKNLRKDTAELRLCRGPAADVVIVDDEREASDG